MKTVDYNFNLPEQIIALHPAEKRDRSRLLVLHKDGSIEHRIFYELVEFLNPGDILLLNNTKVFPARLTGYKPTGGRLDILLVNEISPNLWNIMTVEKYSGYISISEDLRIYIEKGKTARFDDKINIRQMIWEVGKMPLPPYIKRPADDRDKERYQTVFAKNEGSIAAPTAGLHFTGELLEKIRSKSVIVHYITLHVGVGTFKPVRASRLEDHKMEREFFEISSDVIADIEYARENDKKIIAVGTTTTRAIEGFLSGRCEITSVNGTINGSTDIFIYEGYKFKAVNTLITNFHLPCSTPLMLTSALAGREKLLKAYDKAITMGYRFFSYGDAMLVL